MTQSECVYSPVSFSRKPAGIPTWEDFEEGWHIVIGQTVPEIQRPLLLGMSFL